MSITELCGWVALGLAVWGVSTLYREEPHVRIVDPDGARDCTPLSQDHAPPPLHEDSDHA